MLMIHLHLFFIVRKYISKKETKVNSLCFFMGYIFTLEQGLGYNYLQIT